MANVLKYDTGTGAVEWYRRSVDSGQYISVPNDINSPLPGHLINPDISAAGTKIKFWKVSAGAVVLMTQQEQSAVLQAEADAAQAIEDSRIAALDDKMDLNLSAILLTKADNAIDNIGSLSDAKTFLKKLCRFIVKFTVR